MKRLILNLLCILFIPLIYRCKEENPRTIKAWINSSDTMVQKLITKEQPLLDSLCKLKSETYYQEAYDSIYKKRTEEMRLLLDSIPIYERR